MFRTEATLRTSVVMVLLSSASASAADTGPSESLSRLRHQSRQLAARSRAVREDAARVSERVQTNAAARREQDDGTARSENFTVSAPVAGGLAARVLAAAERYRREIALAWLGRELPAGQHRTIIHVELTDGSDVGLAMLDEGRAGLRNRIWLRTSAERAGGTTLAHEIAHIVLGARFPTEMPVWATEGVSCQYDDPSRIARREMLLRQFARTECWPSLSRLLTADVIVPTDEASYAAAVSLTEFLVALDGRPTFLEFVADGRDHGWDAALARHYAIPSMQALESRWCASAHSAVPTK